VTSKSEIKRLATLDPGKLAERMAKLEAALRVVDVIRRQEMTTDGLMLRNDLMREYQQAIEALDALGAGDDSLHRHAPQDG